MPMTPKSRTVKAPDERRRELLDCALRLFAERGYESVSIRDIAREAHVTAGLAYHYFDSKQRLFSAALEEYAQQCAALLEQTLDDASLTLDQKLDRLFSAAADEGGLRHHELLHAPENRGFHDRLSLALCERLYPHVLAAVMADARRRGVQVRSPDVLVDFVVHGQLSLLSCDDAVRPQVLALVREYVDVLLASQTEAG